MENNTCVVQAEYLCRFDSLQKWIDMAGQYLGEYQKTDIFLLDKNRCFCKLPDDIVVQEISSLFPVKAFRMIRTPEYLQETNKT